MSRKKEVHEGGVMRSKARGASNKLTDKVLEDSSFHRLGNNTSQLVTQRLWFSENRSWLFTPRKLGCSNPVGICELSPEVCFVVPGFKACLGDRDFGRVFLVWLSCLLWCAFFALFCFAAWCVCVNKNNNLKKPPITLREIFHNLLAITYKW